MSESNNKRENILARIKKLFELASNKGATENEALQAALMAQRLMSENNVEDWELRDVEDAPKIESVTADNTPRKWRSELAHVIADNFRCKYYISTDWSTGKSNKRIVFFGYEDDAKAAALTFNYLYRVGDRLANREAKRVRESLGWADGVYNSFVLGFCEGVRIELEKQSEALMLVVPEIVKNEFTELTKDFGSTSIRFNWARLAANKYDEGKQHGIDALRERRINAPAPDTAYEADQLLLPA